MEVPLKRIAELPNAHALITELDAATERMMALSADKVGSLEWRRACDRQRLAFRCWLDYLRLQAKEKSGTR